VKNLKNHIIIIPLSKGLTKQVKKKSKKKNFPYTKGIPPKALKKQKNS
jgi:hypothetical protein